MMPLIGFVLEQFVQWKYGVVGTVAFLLLTLGLRFRNSTCASIGSVTLALLFMRPGMD